MDTIPHIFLGVLIMTMTIFGVFGITTLGMDAQSARRFHDSVKQEIEASNLNGNVIDKCGQSAMDKGYTLVVKIRCANNEVREITYDGFNNVFPVDSANKITGAKSVDINLKYKAKLPVFQYIYDKEIRDVA